MWAQCVRARNGLVHRSDATHKSPFLGKKDARTAKALRKSIGKKIIHVQ